jgi:beta-1,4-mannosyltransferase
MTAQDASGLVSVITPCYNAAPFIAETIESVTAQTYSRLEHIVVDDASTDDSWAVVASFGAHVRAIRLEHNGGGSHARNCGAALARGEYLMFLDADDLIAPGTIEAMVRSVRDSPGSVAVCRWWRLRQDAAGAWHRRPSEIPFPPPPDPLRGWLTKTWVPPCAVLWRREAYERTGGWDEQITLNDDGDLMMRALARGVRLVVAEGGQAFYRAHGDARVSMSQSVYTERHLRSEQRVVEKLVAELERLGRLSSYAEPIAFKYHALALLGFQQGMPEFAHECLERGRFYGRPFAVSRTWPGRLLDRLLGIEKKERIVTSLARLGIMTPTRRLSLRRRARLASGGSPATGAEPLSDSAARRPMRILAWPASVPDNPYNSLLYESLSALGAEVVPFSPMQLVRGRAAIWHLHWVEDMWNRPGLVRAGLRAGAILMMLRIAHLRGMSIVWTVHNLHTHERFHPRLEQWFWRSFVRHLDGYLALAEVGRTMAQERFPMLRSLPGFVVPHGHYRGAYPTTIDREAARARLGIAPDERVITFLGKVRPYKNVPHLIRTFRALPEPRVRLFIAGSARLPSLEHEVRAAAGSDQRIQLQLRHIPDDEVQVYLGAADVVVLPYRDILNSGSALLALSFDRPVLVPDCGAMGELAACAGPEWVRTFTGALSVAELAESLQWARAPRPSVCDGLNRLDWMSIARETLHSFECILRRAGRGRPGGAAGVECHAVASATSTMGGMPTLSTGHCVSAANEQAR